MARVRYAGRRAAQVDRRRPGRSGYGSAIEHRTERGTPTLSGKNIGLNIGFAPRRQTETSSPDFAWRFLPPSLGVPPRLLYFAHGVFNLSPRLFDLGLWLRPFRAR